MGMDSEAVFPDLTQKREIDRLLEESDTHGVNRRDVLKMASAAAAFFATAPILAACGGNSGSASSSVSTAAKGGGGIVSNGKLAIILLTNQIEYCTQLDAAAKATAPDFGFKYTGLNGQADSQLELSQFQQQVNSGAKAILIQSGDGTNIRPSTRLAQQRKVYTANLFATQAWFTPFDVGEYYTLYATPDDYIATGLAVKVLAEKLGGKGNIVRVRGIKGSSPDILRTAGANATLAKYPGIKLVGELPGDWNSDKSQQAMQTLLSKNPDIQGVIAQNDDEVPGVLAALRAAGKKAGEDIYVTGADGTSQVAKLINSGEVLVTTASVPQYSAYFFMSRFYDVQNGWKPSAPERIMNWQSITLTKDNVGPYLERYVNNGNTAPFDPKLISKVQSPKDWDPQMEVYPSNLEHVWADIPKPKGYSTPAPWAAAQKSGEMEKVTAEYKDRYKIKNTGPSPAA